MDIIDTIDLGSRDGFDIRADIVQDDTAINPTDVADYQPDTIQAWHDEQWMFVGIIVTASRMGTDLGSDSVWLVERGDMAGSGEVDPLRDKGGSLDTYRADMIDNAVADARLKLTELIDAAIDGSME